MVVDGLVTANSFTHDDLSETTNNAPRTNVVFDAATDMGQGAVASYPFEYTTGLDMIGHAARVYYRMERNAPRGVRHCGPRHEGGVHHL